MMKLKLNVIAFCAICVAFCNVATAQGVEVKNADEAIAALKMGNERFVKGERTYPLQDMERVKSLANTQNPYAAVIACSDSRVPVEHIFDCGVGEIFVIRTAGNTVDDNSTMGTVEYAVSHLGVKLVVVLGHSCCGAVTAAITEEEHAHHHDSHAESFEELNELVANIKSNVKEYVGKMDKLDEAVQKNTKVQLKEINNQSGIKEFIKDDKVEVVSAFYDVRNGVVTFGK